MLDPTRIRTGARAAAGNAGCEDYEVALGKRQPPLPHATGS